MTTLIVSGAYGRDYGSAEAAIADWNDGKDFQSQALTGGTYAGRYDAAELGIKRVNIRYNKLQDVAVVDIAADGTATLHAVDDDWK